MSQGPSDLTDQNVSFSDKMASLKHADYQVCEISLSKFSFAEKGLKILIGVLWPFRSPLETALAKKRDLFRPRLKEGDQTKTGPGEIALQR